MIDWIKDNLEGITFVLTVVPIVLSMLALAFSALKYVFNHNKELKQKEFENYHMILDWLVAGRDGHIRLDSQIACVYELRKYKQYRDVSIRILEGLKESWTGKPNTVRLVKEIDIVLKYLQ
jgi:hypothetical protein